MTRQIRWLFAALALAFLGGAGREPLENSGVRAGTVDRRGLGSAAEDPQAGTWRFAVSGDSRNCGDVVMPAIAAGVQRSGASFFWHLGDFRAIYSFDEDLVHQPPHLLKPLTILEYENIAWPDFIESQIVPFNGIPVFLAMGNHEAISPKSRDDYLLQFADWLDTPLLREQRLRDDPRDFKLRTYYHWIDRGVDFITLDNATLDEFDGAQLEWFERVLQADSLSPAVRTIVAGMHVPLPDSISFDHSMNQSAAESQSGHRVYADLLKSQNESHKRVYVLASHSHYFMDGVFKTAYWRAHGGVLPGWIIGTGGAQRYALPKESASANAAQTQVYGYLLGTVNSDGEITFTFERLRESDVPGAVTDRYQSDFVHWCFTQNSTVN